MLIILPPRDYLNISPKDYVNMNTFLIGMIFIAPDIVRKIFKQFQEDYDEYLLHSSPIMQKLNNTYDDIYKVLIHARRHKIIDKIPDEIITHIDECQAEITGTQRLSYTQRLKLHKIYLKKLIKKTGFKQTIQVVEEKIEEVVEIINIVDEKIQTTNSNTFANARNKRATTEKIIKEDLTIKLFREGEFI